MSSMPLRSQSHLRSEFGSDDAERHLKPRRHEEPQLPRLMHSGIFSEPELLIYTDKSGHFVIRDETLLQISAITQKLVIVGIAGPYRCGKSFLMNRLVGKSKGFFVGKTTEAGTKGIWAWCKIHPKQEETVLLLLDTEGLGDIRKGNKNHDNKILTMITLLCNVLVFNMRGPFDEDSISKLSFATQISKSVKFGREPKKHDVLPVVMPELILCLRDFYLAFRDDIDSPDEYFEDCLKDVEGEDEYNAPRESLKTFFPERFCFTFPLPADEKTMPRLENASEDELSESFLQKADQFIQHVFNCMSKQMYDSEFSVHANITGSIFKSLLEYYVDCTRNGDVPDIESAFFTASQKENEKLMKDVKDEFNSTMKGIQLPLDSLKDVQDKILTDMMNCLRTFRERVKLDKGNIQEKQLQMELLKIWDDTKTENSKLLQNKFVENLMKKYRGTFQETNLAFAKSCSYHEYKKELNRIKMDIENGLNPCLQSEFSLAWSVFKDRIRDDEMFVLETDLKVTKAEKERQRQILQDDHQKTMITQGRSHKTLADEVECLVNLTQLQREREEMNKKQHKETHEELKKYKSLTFWKRFKFAFTGRLEDEK